MIRNQLDTDIQFLPGVGPKRAALLKKELGINTIGELIRFYPFRYIDRTSITPIARVTPDMAYIQIKAKVESISLFEDKGAASENNFNKVKRMSVMVSDSTGSLEMVFFKGIKWMYEKLKPGEEFVFFGKPSTFNGRVNMVHPEVDAPGALGKGLTESGHGSHGERGSQGNHGVLSNQGSPGERGSNGSGESQGIRGVDSGNQNAAQGGGGRMTGIYSSSDKLRNAGITAKAMNKIMEHALNMALPDIEESLPREFLIEKGMVPLHYALRNIHFPADARALEKARYRLKFEELFFLQLSLLKQKYVRSRNEHGIRMPKVGEAFNKCYDSLPFPLTGAQKRVITEIRNDMKSGHQMNRLLQGDVGSGKTMVAVLTALIAVGNGFQACIMAPTEVLAQQHFKNISKYLEGTGVSTALLTGSSKTKERRVVHAGLEDGSIGIIVGTHALLEDNVVFRNLGLAIIDEQHRFGVEQRARLWRKSSCGLAPHILVMTATPIPRTLAMTLYGDLDVSVIDELPPGRKPVQTIAATEAKRLALFKFIKDQIALGRQIFIVYPLIFESEKMDYKNLELGFEQVVKAFPFPPYKTAIVHGQQSNEDKKFNMDAFASGKANILVATSVIEVGVDVPNASVMVIESAERFGLSQLHQLRGRVGRGTANSYCILMTGNKLSKDSKHRIELMCATENGFELAEEDMKMRGPGDLEGTQQSGLPIALNIASLAKDGLILNDAKECAQQILDEDPELKMNKNAMLAAELRKDKYKVRDYSKIS